MLTVTTKSVGGGGIGGATSSGGAGGDAEGPPSCASDGTGRSEIEFSFFLALREIEKPGSKKEKNLHFSDAETRNSFFLMILDFERKKGLKEKKNF